MPMVVTPQSLLALWLCNLDPGCSTVPKNWVI